MVGTFFNRQLILLGFSRSQYIDKNKPLLGFDGGEKISEVFWRDDRDPLGQAEHNLGTLSTPSCRNISTVTSEKVVGSVFLALLEDIY